MATAIVSIMTGIPVSKDIAMTGEVTLRGRVLAIGGLKEKLLAALRGGWLYYHPTSSWACPACVARSDYSGAEYRAAARRMAERVRRALTP